MVAWALVVACVAGWVVVPEAIPAPAAAVVGLVPGSTANAAASRAEGTWEWPLAEHRLTAAYAAPATRYAAGHRGIDLAAVAGSMVGAPAAGVVRFSAVVVDRPVLTLDHGDGVLSSYEPVRSDLPVGAVVARGAVVGTVASGGHCDGSCIHVGVRVNGEYVSPMRFFGRVPPAVLLPLGAG
ncbi:M23 family metallopeptidase [Leifsonia sp. fls2-241-R2A-40a]|uniref:murein hydrolase activator EnvC family protein n=1 Tax=Leifsonia sp. fls2-241-R2A-40a TaxID=3040290 RepID=UPI00254F7F52|nr:M23 family metallopeptidase [Leifsonia sp. fls2-241-R2A-40a]